MSNNYAVICGACLQQPPEYDAILCHYVFDEPLRHLIHAFKYQNALYLCSFLATCMLEARHELQNVDCLIPIPLHKTRLKQRGFNHALLLAKFLSHRLHIPCDSTSCKKIIETPPQATLSHEKRQNSLQKAFTTKPISYKKVILIDDVVTTGSTANAVAKTLKKAGVANVAVWCCARACL